MSKVSMVSSSSSSNNSASSCDSCGVSGHYSCTCPQVYKEANTLYSKPPGDPHSNRYNAGYKRPNLSYSSTNVLNPQHQQTPYQHPPPYKQQAQPAQPSLRSEVDDLKNLLFMSIFLYNSEPNLNLRQLRVFLGYGVNQKGYKCFDPLQNRMYIAMDCDFFEQSYSYTQPSPQGETVSDDLSWLIYPAMIEHDPKEQVGETIDVDFEVIVSHLQFTPVPSNEHPTEQEVTPEPFTHVPSNEHPTEQEVTPEPLIDISNDDVPSVDIPNRYELPPRSTRGVPPKRYDPEFESQSFWYPINRGNDGNLSLTVVAINTSQFPIFFQKPLKKLSGI